MIGPLPKRPTGSGPKAEFMRWMYDAIVALSPKQEVAGRRTNRTTRGFYALDSHRGKVNPTMKSWNAAQAQVNWHGNNGFLDAQICGGACPESPRYGGRKYLVKTVDVAISLTSHCDLCEWSNSEVVDEAGNCDLTGYAWRRCTGDYSHASHNQGTFTIDRRSGCIVPSGCSVVHGAEVESHTGCCGAFSPASCSGAAVNPIFLRPYSCVVGGTTNFYDPVDFWASLDYKCGAWQPITDACGTTFPGGADSSINDFFPAGSGAVVTIDTVTDNGTTAHIGFTVTWDLDFDAADQDCPTDPPGPDDPHIIYKRDHVHGSLSVSIDLSSPYTFDDLVTEAYGLLAHWPLNSTPFHDGPGPCGPIPLLTYDNAGCCASGTAPCINPCSYTGNMIGAPGGTAQFAAGPLTYGAFLRFDAIGDTGVLTVQKWAQRQRNFKQYGWQAAAAKTWRYLYLQWTANFCTAVATRTCTNKTGANQFVMCISPNAETWSNGATVWATTGPFPEGGGERTVGSMWQGMVIDATGDTWPDCYPSPANSDPVTYVEPASCDCICPDATACGPPGAGVCPEEPPRNNP